MTFRAALTVLIVLGAGVCLGNDWPTYMFSPSRSGACDNKLDMPLSKRWTHRTELPPQPAWPPPAKRDFFHNRTPKPLVTYDQAFHLISADGRIYFGSSADDAVHCIDQATGRELWAFQTEGPIRLAPSYADGRIVFGSDDGCVYAIDAKTGKLVWKTRPVEPDVRLPGNQRIISLYPIRSSVLIDEGEGHFCAGIFPKQGVYRAAVDLKSGKLVGTVQMKICAEGYVSKHDGRLFMPTGRVHKGSYFDKLARRGTPSGKKSKSSKRSPSNTIRNGRFIIRGGDKVVAITNAGSGKELWRATVEGKALSLVISNNMLLVGTDKGVIHAFGKGNEQKPPQRAERRAASKPAPEALKQAKKLVDLAKTTRGYCLVVGSDTKLARALAAVSEYNVILRMADEKAAVRARSEIRAARLTHRVRVHRGAAAELPYVSHMFNIVHATRSSAELWRVTRPEGGVLIADGSAKRRGKLKGSGEWTHFYADAGNTGASNDQAAWKKLRLQWFGEPGPEHMVDRHNRAMPSLCKDGRMFVPGDNWFAAVDAYNGTVIWEREIQGSVRATAFKSSGNAAVGANHLLVAAGSECMMLDPRSGTTLAKLSTPNSQDDWCYVATSNGIVYGSDTAAGALRWKFHRTSWNIGYSQNTAIICSRSLFAYDLASRKRKSRYRPKKGVILTPTIALDGKTIFFIESTSPGIEQAFDKYKAHLSLQPKQKDPGLASQLHLVALETGSLKAKWRKPISDLKLKNCVFLTATDKKILVYGSRVADKILYDIRCFSQSDGRELWKHELAPRAKDKSGAHGELMQHGVVANGKFYLYDAAISLSNGERIKSWTWNRQGHGCGVFSASQTGLFWRGKNPRYTPFANGFKGDVICTVTRPGCWIGIIPAGGLVLIPETSSGCTCAYPVQCSMAFRPE